VAFELIVAAKRDPADGAEMRERDHRTRQLPSMPGATIDVNGVFSQESARTLVQQIEGVLHNPADTVVIRFQQIACEDPQSLVHFTDWLNALRAQGHDVRAVAEDPRIHAWLTKLTSPDAIMLPAESDAVTGRRVVDVREGTEGH
jgi:hypothetical protein